MSEPSDLHNRLTGPIVEAIVKPILANGGSPRDMVVLLADDRDGEDPAGGDGEGCLMPVRNGDGAEPGVRPDGPTGARGAPTPTAPPAPRKARRIKVADLFCGAGGSSTGAKQAIEQLGREMDLVCINHWDRAIETHRRMHPEARHYCQDVASARPIECVPEGWLDLLIASPTCTYHSRARGGRPTSDQQRMDPWHVVTWLTELRVERLLIENVPEFVDWGPVDPRTGKPVKARRGTYFREWIATLERLGYRVDWKFLNCADYGDATTRRRFFLMGRKAVGKGRGALRWPEPTHTKEPGHDLLAPLQRWRPARECIDWALKGRSIFGRKNPLAPRTIQRIYAGAVRFRWPEPFLVVLRQHMDGRSIDLPVPTIAANGNHVGLVTPVLIRSDAHGATKLRGRSPDEPMQTIVGSGGIGVAEPFVIGQHFDRQVRSVDEPVPAATTIARAAGVEPFIMNAAHGVKPTERDHTRRRIKALDDPLGTIHAQGGSYGVVEPFILSQASGGAPRPLSSPFPTITTGGQQGRGEGTALITPYYGGGSGKTCKPVDEPLDTVTTLDRFGLIVPVTNGGGGPVARDIGQPLPTLTTSKGGHIAFITASFGERDGQLPRVHDLELPMPTIPAQGSVRLAEGEQPGAGGQQYDILFRMLHWRELARAMSFSDAEQDYEFAGTKTEITKQIGNAVPVRTARALVAAALSDMAA
jgi:DNA (cytosine-5)-methyltransferase 1